MRKIVATGLTLGLLFGYSIGNVRAAEPVACWKVEALMVAVGNDVKRATRIAREHGYTREQIEEARKRCGY